MSSWEPAVRHGEHGDQHLGGSIVEPLTVGIDMSDKVVVEVGDTLAMGVAGEGIEGGVCGCQQDISARTMTAGPGWDNKICFVGKLNRDLSTTWYPCLRCS